ncbi:hypothetical protein D3C81_2241560 [compost metagenome]
MSNNISIGNVLFETFKKKYENRINVSQINVDEFEEQCFDRDLLIAILNPYDKKNCEDITSKTKKIT